MPRPRFYKLTTEQQESILRVASEEFAQLGFEEASYNRIIERAGVSKGAMYYYFDDKEDVYATAVSRSLQRFTRVFEWTPEARVPGEFWQQTEDFFGQAFAQLGSDATDTTLVMRYLRGRADARIAERPEQIIERGRDWIGRILSAGTRADAVRRDIPIDLLTSVVFSMGQVIDGWLAQAWQGEAHEQVANLPSLMVDLMRRLVAPAASLPAGAGSASDPPQS